MIGEDEYAPSQDRDTSVPLAHHPLARGGASPLEPVECKVTLSAALTTPLRADPTSLSDACASPSPTAEPRRLSTSAPPPASASSAAHVVIQQRPTPWAVTAVYSPHDWSVAPRLGFAASTDPAVVAAEAQWRASTEAEEIKGEQQWHALCRGVPLLASASPEVQSRIRQGARKHSVPKHLRGVLWMTATGLALKTDENEYFCRAMLHRLGFVSGPVGDAIEADLERTFPGHPYFSAADVGLYKLKNVLHALCWRNPLIEYCQCFNFLAAFALLVVDDEERALWLLIHILETLLPNDYYNSSLIGVKVDQIVLVQYVREKLPKLSALFTQLDYDVEAIVPLWMMSLFVTTLPAETTLRVWDYVLMESAPQGYLRSTAPLEITLAILKMAEPALLVCEDLSEVTVALRRVTASLFNAAKLLATARSMALVPNDVHQRRRHAKLVVSQEIREKAQQRAEREEQRLAREWQRAKATSEELCQSERTEPLPVRRAPSGDRSESGSRSVEMKELP